MISQYWYIPKHHLFYSIDHTRHKKDIYNSVENLLKNEFITCIDKKFLWQYFTGNISLFRYYQNIYLENIGKYFHGTVIEIGGITTINNKQYFRRSLQPFFFGIQE